MAWKPTPANRRRARRGFAAMLPILPTPFDLPDTTPMTPDDFDPDDLRQGAADVLVDMLHFLASRGLPVDPETLAQAASVHFATESEEPDPSLTDPEPPADPTGVDCFERYEGPDQYELAQDAADVGGL